MRLIKRQFGAFFAQLLSLSPSMLADLEQARAQGVRIRRVRKLAGAWCEPEKKIIYIGRKNSERDQLLNLAHEFQHMLRPRIEGVRKATYVRRSIEEEADCIEHEIHVMDELMSSGIRFGYSAMHWYRRYRRGGRQAFVVALEHTRASTTNEKYPRYYARQFDENKVA